MRIGVLGGGQLGRMLGLAGIPLGLEFRFLDPNPESPVRAVGELTVAGFEDTAAIDRFAEGLDVVTYEFENVPVESARHLAGRVPVHPAAEALENAQDRIVEKSFFAARGVPVPGFAPVSSLQDLEKAIGTIGTPSVLKTRRFGYDGKGQAVLHSRDDCAASWEAVGKAPSILEAFVPFDRELSILAVRGLDGTFAAYPLVENRHGGGILRESRAPAPNVPVSLQQTAERHARAVMEELRYVGVLAIEFFDVAGELVANEMAPRVHNSGHWTIEGSETSQFENHLRAICGMPLGSTAARGESWMANLIGTRPDRDGVLRVAGAHWHDYGKLERSGRKIGHVTLRADDPRELEAGKQALKAVLALEEKEAGENGRQAPR